MKRALLPLVLSLSACGGTPSPTRTAHDFAALIDAQSYGAAWALLSAESRASIDRHELERRLRENREERVLLVEKLRSDVSERQAEALYPLADGRVVRLVLEDGEWKLDGAILDVYSQETPRLAIASFARALRGRRYDVLLRFIPRAYLTPDLDEERLRASIEDDMPQEMAAILQKLEDSSTTPIEESGDRARMSLGGVDAVLLVREEGVWKIEDLY